MKTLSNYTEEKTSNVLKKYGAFFAFSDKQFNENKKENVKYSRLYSGLIAPSENVKKIMSELEKVNNEGIKQDIKENGIKNIIHRELANYECQITGDVTDACDILKDYGVSEEQVLKEYKIFYEKCIKNDWF
tara:strand:+ start:619 stop:1014 length:396 start_codon:yes stop_codon:yes gene_type:complete